MRKTLVLILVALLALAIVPAMAEECTHEDYEWIEIVVNYPNCEASGRADLVCTNCNTVVDTTVLPAIGHAWEITEVTEATCTEKGEIKYACTHTDCYATKTEEIAVLEHDWVFVRVVEPASCEKKGYDLYKCTRCSEYKTEETEALEHNWVEIAHKDATCTENGFTQSCCATCGATDTVEEKALGHAFTEWVIDQNPGCETQGMRTRYCTRDCCYDASLMKAYKETEVIPAHGHRVDEAHATKNKDGSYTGTCIYCSETVTVGNTIGEYNDDPSSRPQNKTGESSTGVKIPATGTESNSWAYGMMLVSAAMLVALTAKRRALQK